MEEKKEDIITVPVLPLDEVKKIYGKIINDFIDCKNLSEAIKNYLFVIAFRKQRPITYAIVNKKQVGYNNDLIEFSASYNFPRNMMLCPNDFFDKRKTRQDMVYAIRTLEHEFTHEEDCYQYGKYNKVSNPFGVMYEGNICETALNVMCDTLDTKLSKEEQQFLKKFGVNCYITSSNEVRAREIALEKQGAFLEDVYKVVAKTRPDKQFLCVDLQNKQKYSVDFEKQYVKDCYTAVMQNKKKARELYFKILRNCEHSKTNLICQLAILQDTQYFYSPNAWHRLAKLVANFNVANNNYEFKSLDDAAIYMLLINSKYATSLKKKRNIQLGNDGIIFKNYGEKFKHVHFNEKNMLDTYNMLKQINHEYAKIPYNYPKDYFEK